MSTTYGPLTIQVVGQQWSTQYSADAEHTIAGIGLHVYTGFNNFTVTVQNGVVIGFSVYVYNGGEGILAPSPSISGSFSCTVNGITPPFVNNSTTFPQTITYTSPADGPPPVTVNFTASTTGTVYTQSATASYSLTYGLYAQTENLVFSSYDASINMKLVFLEPITPSNNGKLIAIKDKTFNCASMHTVVYTPPTTAIEGNAAPGNAAAVLFNNGQCNTYIIDLPNSIYRIANIYPSTNQPSLPTLNPTGLTPVLASSDIADIFSVDSGITPNRTTSNNLVELPAVSNPTGIGSLKILIYGGYNSAKYTGNALVIQEPSGGNLIDSYYASTIKPYIQTDSTATANEKNTGIVFISNEDQWFVLGYYPTAPWSWSVLAPPSSATTTIPNIDIQFDLLASPASASFVAMPMPTLASLSLVKVQAVAGSAPYVTFIVPGSGNRFNENVEFLSYNGDSTTSTTWFLSYYTGTKYLYYIVAAYTPN